MTWNESDEQFVLELLNSRPIVDGREVDALATFVSAQGWTRTHDVSSSRESWRALVEARDVLTGYVHGRPAPARLRALMREVVYEPQVSEAGLEWNLRVSAGNSAAAHAVLAWDELRRSHPGRLRACANTECQLFLIDRSKANSARWCSMATCGNRMKARRHHERAKNA